jgi:hypothetical protein
MLCDGRMAGGEGLENKAAAAWLVLLRCCDANAKRAIGTWKGRRLASIEDDQDNLRTPKKERSLYI